MIVADLSGMRIAAEKFVLVYSTCIAGFFISAVQDKQIFLDWKYNFWIVMSNGNDGGFYGITDIYEKIFICVLLSLCLC